MNEVFVTGIRVTSWLVAMGWIWKAVTAWRGLPTITNLLESELDRSPPGSPSITVIVPARNEAEALRSCLKSLLAQDYQNLQIIVVDDRSTDSTAEYLCAQPDCSEGRELRLNFEITW